MAISVTRTNLCPINEEKKYNLPKDYIFFFFLLKALNIRKIPPIQKQAITNRNPIPNQPINQDERESCGTVHDSTVYPILSQPSNEQKTRDLRPPFPLRPSFVQIFEARVHFGSLSRNYKIVKQVWWSSDIQKKKEEKRRKEKKTEAELLVRDDKERISGRWWKFSGIEVQQWRLKPSLPFLLFPFLFPSFFFFEHHHSCDLTPQ